MSLLKFLPLLSLLLVSPLAHAEGLEDDFSEAKREDRLAMRGAWTFEENTARCVADPELYKKFKDHGPILRWPVAMTGGTVSCEFQAKGCQRLVLTLNETGHVFRIILMDGANEKARSRIIGWAGSSKTTDPNSLAKETVPTLANLEDAWTKLSLSLEGNRAVVSIGDYTETLEHASIARPKGEFTISFASGELAVRNVKVTPTE